MRLFCREWLFAPLLLLLTGCEQRQSHIVKTGGLADVAAHSADDVSDIIIQDGMGHPVRWGWTPARRDEQAGPIMRWLTSGKASLPSDEGDTRFDIDFADGCKAQLSFDFPGDENSLSPEAREALWSLAPFRYGAPSIVGFVKRTPLASVRSVEFHRSGRSVARLEGGRHEAALKELWASWRYATADFGAFDMLPLTDDVTIRYRSGGKDLAEVVRLDLDHLAELFDSDVERAMRAAMAAAPRE